MSAAGCRLVPLAILTALLAVSGWGPVAAQVPAAPVAVEQGPKWETLAPAQQSALAPLRGDWARIDEARKRKWIEVAARFPRMSAEEQKRVQVRMTEWAHLSPAERGRARVQFQEARQLPPQDRQERWEAYQALPDEERRALAERAAPAARAKPPVAPQRAGAGAAKRNVVTTVSVPPAPPKPVAPTVIQARPGATTTLVSKPATPPAHHQAGLPKIAATSSFVDPTTLLPKRGPQGAAVVSERPAAAPASAARRP